MAIASVIHSCCLKRLAFMTAKNSFKTAVSTTNVFLVCSAGSAGLLDLFSRRKVARKSKSFDFAMFASILSGLGMTLNHILWNLEVYLRYGKCVANMKEEIHSCYDLEFLID